MEERNRIKGEFTVCRSGSPARREVHRQEGRDKMPESYRKLIRNTAVCAALALMVWGIKTADAELTAQVGDSINSVVTNQSEMVDDEDLGRLKYVNGEAEDSEAIDVSAEGYSAPMEGQVVTTFAESGRNVVIQSEAESQVCAVLDGVVSSISGDSITVNNENGTVTTYSGVTPSVQAGAAVRSAQLIGHLKDTELTVETVSGIGYIDPLDASAQGGMEG